MKGWLEYQNTSSASIKSEGQWGGSFDPCTELTRQNTTRVYTVHWWGLALCRVRWLHWLSVWNTTNRVKYPDEAFTSIVCGFYLYLYFMTGLKYWNDINRVLIVLIVLMRLTHLLRVLILFVPYSMIGLKHYISINRVQYADKGYLLNCVCWFYLYLKWQDVHTKVLQLAYWWGLHTSFVCIFFCTSMTGFKYYAKTIMV